jgi:hypothetical protein
MARLGFAVAPVLCCSRPALGGRLAFTLRGRLSPWAAGLLNEVDRVLGGTSGLAVGAAPGEAAELASALGALGAEAALGADGSPSLARALGALPAAGDLSGAMSAPGGRLWLPWPTLNALALASARCARPRASTSKSNTPSSVSSSARIRQRRGGNGSGRVDTATSAWGQPESLGSAAGARGKLNSVGNFRGSMSRESFTVSSSRVLWFVAAWSGVGS